MMAQRIAQAMLALSVLGLIALTIRIALLIVVAP